LAEQPTLEDWEITEKEKLSLHDLEQFLWKAANILRKPSEYKDYILALLFYKRLDDVYIEEYKKLLKKYEDEEIAKEKFHRFVIPDGCHWSDVRKVSTNVGEKLNEVLEKIAKRNPELDGVINRIDFNDKQRLPEHKLVQLIEHFSKINLGNGKVEPDVLGRAYEYLIKQFALESGKKGGEFYTPKEVVRVLVEILSPDEGYEVCDPACGSGGMLIESFYYLKRKGKDTKKILLYGQEIDFTTWMIAKMNMILHGIEAEIILSDSLSDPRFLEEDGSLKKFDIVLTNPPWNQKGYRAVAETDKFRRFVFGIAPENSADWAWIQHLLATLKDDGRGGIVLDMGSLFRGGAEKEIRKKVIEKDWLDCVIALPEKLFYNTGAPGCLIIFNKNKPEERKGKILFINASTEYEELRNMNRLRDQDIEKIIKAYFDFKDGDGYSRVVDVEEIRENDYNLNVSLYVAPIVEEEEVDIPKVWQTIESREKEREEVLGEIKEYLEELKLVG